jgi:hypothetical protein
MNRTIGWKNVVHQFETVKSAPILQNCKLMLHLTKYGYTKDFSKITETLRQKYAYMDKVNLQLLHHEYIDQEHIFEAESDIKLFVDSMRMKLDYEKEDELIVIPQRLERQVKQEYALIGNKYVPKKHSISMHRLSSISLQLMSASLFVILLGYIKLGHG